MIHTANGPLSQVLPTVQRCSDSAGLKLQTIGEDR